MEVNVKLSINDMRQVAAAKNGKCLSSHYTNSQTKLKWECAEGHQWLAVPNSIRQGTWCSRCNGNNPPTIEGLQQIAISYEGKCLSKAYCGSNVNLEFECKKGHRWLATPHNIMRGTWCKKCYHHRVWSIDYMHTLAASRRGKCLSDAYAGSVSNLRWQCSSGHEWLATPSNIRSGSWCLTCSRTGSSHGERISRLVMEAMFQVPFVKMRPAFLRLPGKKQGMELDGYAEMLKTAFEYQGPHHYEGSRGWAADKRKVAATQKWDALKRKLCWGHGVHLVVIPEFTDHHNLDRCIAEIDFAVLRAGLKPQKRWKRPTDISVIYDPLERVFGPDRVKKMHLVAADRGGLLLSKAASHTTTKLHWRCQGGHEWQARSASVLRGAWCSVCKGRPSPFDKRYAIEDMHTQASKRSGRCLSEEYVNSGTKLEWECAQGHTWWAAPETINLGKWCRKCAGLLPLTLEDMQAAAIERDGKCLSTEYVNSATKLEWECSKGHKWHAVSSSVRAGTWCPECAGNFKLTIEHMHQWAATHDGKCLSETYVNSDARLEWECNHGHRWWTRANTIKAGSWCKKCSAKKANNATRDTIENMRRLASERDGKCLSETYINAHSKIEWECGQGHRWHAVPSSIKSGKWCSRCRDNKLAEDRRSPIEATHRLASARGGKCLSEEYINARTGLEWECHEGHRWVATSGNIHNGTWCPKCSRTRRAITADPTMTSTGRFMCEKI